MAIRQMEQTTETAKAEKQQASFEKERTVQRGTAVSSLAGIGGDPNTQANNLHQLTNGNLARAGNVLLQLQNQYGNRYVQQLVNPQQRLTVQPKLMLGDVDTPSEREADQIANQVTSKQPATTPTPVSGPMTAVSAEIENSIRQAKGSGSPLSDKTRTSMEEAYGVDLSSVRVHTDSRADSLNQVLQATAFTTGQDIFFRQGAYSPGSSSGQNLLAHELTHVIQQTAAPVMQRKAQSEQHGSGCGCATCSGTLQLKRDQHTAGCGCPACSTVQLKPASDRHTPGCGCEACSNVQRNPATDHRKISLSPMSSSASDHNIIQRHSSHEHYLLGQTDPDELANISFIREARQKVKDGKLQDSNYAQKYREAKHTIQQHLKLLENFITDPEFLEKSENRNNQEPGNVYEKQEASGWEVPYLRLPVASDNQDGGSDTLTILYGELNTLPDFFGSPDVIAKTPRSTVLGLVQGVRQRVYVNLLRYYNTEIIDTKDEVWQDKRAVKFDKNDNQKKRKKKTQKVKDEDAKLKPGQLPNEQEAKRLNKLEKLRVDFKGALGERYSDNPLSVNIDVNTQFKTVFDPPKDEFGQKTGQSRGKLEKVKTSDTMFAALERNACHFPPDSWNAWERYHKQALAFAKKSTEINPFGLTDYNIVSESNEPDAIEDWDPFGMENEPEPLENWDPFGVENVDDEANNRNPFLQEPPNNQNDWEENDWKEILDLRNKALLYNGFGDHFLQDSYASGHLLNKTFIMQKAVQYVAKNKSKWKKWVGMEDVHKTYGKQMSWAMVRYITEDDQGNLRNLNVSDPQKLQDEISSGQFTKGKEEYQDELIKDMTPMERAAHSLGLDPADEILFLMWWRDRCFETKDKESTTKRTTLEHLKEMQQGKNPIPNFRTFNPKSNTAAQDLEYLLLKLVGRSFVKKKDDNNKYEIQPGIRRQLKGTGRRLGKQKPGYISQLAGKSHNYRELGAEFNLQAYNQLMQRAFIQKVTNYLHDIYCREGLDVKTGEGNKVFTIYGDRSMLKAGAQEGVKHSAETALRSRNAIIKTFLGQELEAKDKIPAIKKRFPQYVVPRAGAKQGQSLTLANWNEKVLATDDVFKGALDTLSNNKESWFGKHFAGGTGLAQAFGGPTFDFTPLFKYHDNDVF